MPDAALLVERRHRLGPQTLPARGPQRPERHQRVNLPDHAFHQIAALVDLGHQTLGAVTLHRGDGGARPVGRAAADAGILQHPGPPVARLAAHLDARHHDPAFVAARAPGHGRIDGNDDPVQTGRLVLPGRLKHGGGPQRALDIIQQHALQLLPAQPRAAIARLDLGQEALGQIGAVGIGRRMRHHGRGIAQDPLQHAHIARRGGDDLLRMLAQTQRELQHVPDILGLLPLGQLVHPGRIELRPPQRLGLMRRIAGRGRAIGPDQTLAPGLPDGAAVGRRTGQDARLAKDHHLAHLIEGLTDQRDAVTAPRRRGGRPLDHPPHPFRPGAGLARAAPAHDDP